MTRRLKGIIPLGLFTVSIWFSNHALAFKIFEPRVRDYGKYDALCAVSGGFDGCSVYIEKKKINSISIDGARELDLCHEKARIGYRSNPSSPYRRISSDNNSLEKIASKEKGIDHDFLFAVPKPDSPRRETLIVRYKNHKVAVDFAGIVDLALNTCESIF